MELSQHYRGRQVADEGGSGGRHTKLFRKLPSKEFSQSLLDFSRTNIKRVVEAITNQLNKHLFHIGYKDSPKCLCGHEDETGFHVICDCPKFR